MTSPFAFSGLLSVVDSATILCIRRRPTTLSPASSLDDLAARFGPRFSRSLFGGRSSVTFASGWQVKCTATRHPNPEWLLLLLSHLFTALPVLCPHDARGSLSPCCLACLGSISGLPPSCLVPAALPSSAWSETRSPTRSAHSLTSTATPLHRLHRYTATPPLHRYALPPLAPRRRY